MTMIRAHWNQGRVVLDEPAELSEGCRLIVTPADETEIRGMTEEEQGDDPASIAKWIAEWDSIPPLEMSPEEEAEMWAWHKRVGDYTIEAIRQQWQRNDEP